MQQHAYVIEGEVEEGIAHAEAFIKDELGMKTHGNVDVIILRYGVLGAEEARGIATIASSAAVAGDKKAIVIATGRAYHEAQNALLKIFEEPPPGAYLFLIISNLGGLLPTLKSRVAILGGDEKKENAIPDVARDFIKMSPEKRSALIQKLAKGKDEEERREHRDEALAIVNGLERVAYEGGVEKHQALLNDLGLLRSYLHDRSAPVRMILEHISLTLPKL